MEKILVIEDDFDLSGIICDFLKNETYEVLPVYEGDTGLLEAKKYNPTLIILDIMLPKTDGIEICKNIRTYSHAPIIIISAKSSDTDKLLSLGVGADDYLTKPFSMIELVARVKSHLRRYISFENAVGAIEGQREIVKTYGDIEIHVNAKKVTAFNREINLTAKEYKLLEFLFDHPKQVFSKEQIMTHVWGYNEFIDDNTIAVYIGRLREKLSQEEVCYIKTVWGMGYKWEK